MLNKSMIFFCLAVILFTSCQKDLKTQPTALNGTSNGEETTAVSSSTGILDTSSHWYGDYVGLFHNYPDVSDAELIKNGIAQLPYLDRQFSFSEIIYDIPKERDISGDTISFEARVKNLKMTGFEGSDVMLQLVGEQHTAAVHFTAEDEYSAYTNYSVGDMKISGLTELVHYFGTFQDLKLAQKNYYTGVYINNNLVYKFKYGKKNSIGKLKSVIITFKGYGSCTKTGLKSSLNKAPILSEDFNTEGQSNTLYY